MALAALRSRLAILKYLYSKAREFLGGVFQMKRRLYLTNVASFYKNDATLYFKISYIDIFLQ